MSVRPAKEDVDGAIKRIHSGERSEEWPYWMDDEHMLAAEVLALRRDLSTHECGESDPKCGWCTECQLRTLKEQNDAQGKRLREAAQLLATVNKCGGDDSDLRRRIERWLTPEERELA